MAPSSAAVRPDDPPSIVPSRLMLATSGASAPVEPRDPRACTSPALVAMMEPIVSRMLVAEAAAEVTAVVAAVAGMRMRREVERVESECAGRERSAREKGLVEGAAHEAVRRAVAAFKDRPSAIVRDIGLVREVSPKDLVAAKGYSKSTATRYLRIVTGRNRGTGKTLRAPLAEVEAFIAAGCPSRWSRATWRPARKGTT